ncbi:MAG: ribose 5-phosphate isomerase [Miltoncostaeaceae bacterium]|nr:ribose 5-phosphate isomerase [Miltoncostaeaceae bacterium]
MRVGLGTGRAAAAGIAALGERVRQGLRCAGVPTSPASERLARLAGVPIIRLRGPLDLAFDGADAVDPAGLIVKGAGGAMVRERIVASAARRFLVLVEGPKLVRSLDEWGLLPIAVVPFAAAWAAGRLADLQPARRPRPSDDGMALLDLRPPAGSDWREVAARARALPGVLDHGLFEVDLQDVLVGEPDGRVQPASALVATRA